MGDLDTLDGVEQAVEQFYLDALPDLEKAQLVLARERTREEKNTRQPDDRRRVRRGRQSTRGSGCSCAG